MELIHYRLQKIILERENNIKIGEKGNNDGGKETNEGAEKKFVRGLERKE